MPISIGVSVTLDTKFTGDTTPGGIESAYYTEDSFSILLESGDDTLLEG